MKNSSLLVLISSVLLSSCNTGGSLSASNSSSNITSISSVDFPDLDAYYFSAQNLSSSSLKIALHNIIKGHTVRTYGDLWTDFQVTDIREDGKVWDMYSTCDFTFGTHQDKGSGGGAECQYYNREHSFPKSWFNDAEPMYTDLFHLYPTDKYVNAERGNYPYGEISNPNKTYSNGSKKGTCSFSGCSGIVFEPSDEYKGDFARTYFYMATRYQDVINGSSWKSPHFNNNSYPTLNSWSIALFLKWHIQDPVSQKELNRNEAVFGLQKNRNPFIDYPEFAELIWSI